MYVHTHAPAYKYLKSACKIIGTFQRLSTAFGTSLLLKPVGACSKYFESVLFVCENVCKSTCTDTYVCIIRNARSWITPCQMLQCMYGMVCMYVCIIYGILHDSRSWITPCQMLQCMYAYAIVCMYVMYACIVGIP